MGGQRLICADGERVDGGSALGDGVCGGAADYGDGENGTGEGGSWGGFGPWRSNLRKSSVVEYSGATFNSRSVQ